MTDAPVVLSAETFDPYVGQIFKVVGGEHALALSDVEIGAKADWSPRAPFTLVFSAPPGNVLAEGLHTLAVQDGATFDLYLIPIHTPAPGRQDYQAVFN